MKVFFDTEFTELSSKAQLISLALIDEKENSFYAEFTDYDSIKLNEWVKENVINNLIYLNSEPFSKVRRANGHIDVIVKGTKSDIKQHLKAWFDKYDKVELVTDVGHYDMVLLIDIFGTAFDLPKNVAPTYIDVNQMLAGFYDIPISEAFDISRENFAFGDRMIEYENKHNAMWDAYVIKEVWSKLIEKRE